MNDIKAHFQEARAILTEFLSNDSHFEQIAKAGKIMVDALSKGNKIISCGNGGSLCDAMHFAEELTGRFREDRRPLAAIAISDPAHITCTANDYGYKYIFSRFVESVGNSGDVLLAISTSGNSENVIEAIKAAKAKDMSVIGLTGKTGGNMAVLCNIEIRAPNSKYADRVQEIHIKVIHSLIDYIEQEMKLKGEEGKV